jgi:hypothetical protein
MTAVKFSGKGQPLTQPTVDAGVLKLNIALATFWTVMAVETRGFGFLPDRRPVILYERHIFHQRTGGKYSAKNPDISNAQAGGYGAAGANQYDRLAKAIALDKTAALESASWGLGQIMGFNATDAGYASVDAMVNAMADSEDAQMNGMAAFIDSHGLAKHLKAQNWDEFAKRYNGSGYKKNHYDTKLNQAYNLYSVHPTPDLRVRLAQAALLYLGFNPKGVDGVFGIGSQKALISYQKSKNLSADGQLSDAIVTRLQTEAF